MSSIRYQDAEAVFRVAIAVAGLTLVSCGTGGEGNLWSRDFAKLDAGRSASAGPTSDVRGYWEGTVAMGGVRTRIEEGKITIALKCDRDGKILSQGSTPIAFKHDPQPALVLLEDLMSGKDEVCGFRFAKGSEFNYRLLENGSLELDFAGTSMAAMRKLSN